MFAWRNQYQDSGTVQNIRFFWSSKLQLKKENGWVSQSQSPEEIRSSCEIRSRNLSESGNPAGFHPSTLHIYNAWIYVNKPSINEKNKKIRRRSSSIYINLRPSPSRRWGASARWAPEKSPPPPLPQVVSDRRRPAGPGALPPWPCPIRQVDAAGQATTTTTCARQSPCMADVLLARTHAVAGLQQLRAESTVGCCPVGVVLECIYYKPAWWIDHAWDRNFVRKACGTRQGDT